MQSRQKPVALRDLAWDRAISTIMRRGTAVVSQLSALLVDQRFLIRDSWFPILIPDS
jgi:hypothetical protein